MSTFNMHDNIINVSDLTDRVDELRQEVEAYENPEGDLEAHDADADSRSELTGLEEILSELAGGGGDHQWDGTWYPGYLIAESHFEEYMDEMVADCYSIPELPSFMTVTLDYAALRMDYTEIEIDGVTYFYR
jgi:hypothetical protein